MTDEHITAYLLEELTEEEAERFEEQCFTEEKWSEEIDAAEQELIDAYLRNELTHDRRRRFSPCPDRPDRGPRRAQSGAPTAPGRRHRLAAHAGALKGRMAAALAAILFVGPGLAEVDAERAQLSVQVRALHADAFR